MSIENLGTKLDRAIYRETYRGTVCHGCPMNKYNYPDGINLPMYWACYHIMYIVGNKCDKRPASSLPWPQIWAEGWE